jgi:hypothetical protein
MNTQDINACPQAWLKLAEHKPAYVIVDGAQWRELFEETGHPFTHNKHFKLLQDTPEHAAADYWPIVFPVTLEQTSLLAELARINPLKPSVLWLISCMPSQDIAKTLSDKLYHQDSQGRTILLRYYDPRVLTQLRAVFKPEDWDTLFEDIDYVSYWDSMQGWIAHSKEQA